MGDIGERIEQINKTFGIEIEFCTHDSEILSFTHIEVCTITHGVGEWKIETDADYTLELVSPILTFGNHQEANEFKASLMARLDEIVRAEPTLGTCVDKIVEFLKTKPINYLDIKTNKEITVKKNTDATIKYINKKTLIEELDYHNWDEDTNLERVLAQKKKIDSVQDFNSEKYFEGVMLSPSKKHGGLPSSQLNHPMSLNTYVWYSMYIKEPKAWFRVIASSQDDFLKDWMTKKSDSIKRQYSHLNQDQYKTWKQRYLNDDYLEKRQDENIQIWHRYWFWLVSIREIADNFWGNDENNWNIPGVQEIKSEVMQLVIKHSTDNNNLDNNNLDYNKLEEKFKELKNKLENFLKLDASIKIDEDLIFQDDNFPGFQNKRDQALYNAMYVTIHKLISGALGVLSEPEQEELQKMIIAMKGELDANVLKSCVANPEFLHFHYALKDLTPLWFKGSLGDVLEMLNSDDLITLKNNLNNLKSDDVEDLLNNNLKFLGRIYVLNEYFNHGNPYDWEEFKETLLPSVSGFVRQFEKGKIKLLEELESNKINEFKYQTINQKTKDNKFLDRTNVPAWEGRWDTIKPAMGTITINSSPHVVTPKLDSPSKKRKIEVVLEETGRNTEERGFLVEHRNN